MNKLKLLSLVAFLALAWGPSVLAQCQSTFKVVDSDVKAFRSVIADWNDNSKAQKEALLADYVETGSKGLKAFHRIKIRDLAKFRQTIDEHYAYYQNLSVYHQELQQLRQPIAEIFKKMKRYSPNACPKDVYFVVGRMRSAGTLNEDAILIGVEHFADAKVKIPGKKIIDEAYLLRVIAHEYVHHFQRQAGKPWLIRGAVFEGGADYIAEQLSNITPVQQANYQFGLANEKVVWQKFKEKMYTSDFKDWLANRGTPDWPGDLGYFVGYRIVEAFFANMSDKQQAFKLIMTANDPEKILAISKYSFPD